MTCNHGQSVQGEEQCGVQHFSCCSQAPSIVTPPEELPEATLVTLTGHKALSLIDAHFKLSQLTDIPINAF